MNDMIEALQIFSKYVDPDIKSHMMFGAEHDQIVLFEVNPEDVSPSDKTRVERLGWFLDDSEECFVLHVSLDR